MDNLTITSLVMRIMTDYISKIRPELDVYESVCRHLNQDEEIKEVLSQFQYKPHIFEDALGKTLLEQLETKEDGFETELTALIEQYQQMLSQQAPTKTGVSGSGASASEGGTAAGAYGYAAGRDIIVNHYHTAAAAESPKEQWQEKADYLQAAMEAYVEQLQQQIQHSGATTVPYKGLLYYEPSDEKIFFGREKEQRQLLACIQGRGKVHRVSILHATSGSGKTSLINAGIVPTLIRAGAVVLYTLPKVGKNYQSPEDTIRKRILDALLGTDLPKPDLSELTLHQFLGLASLGLNDKPLVIFLDQFEDFFIYQTPEDQESFVSALAECYDDEVLPVKFVLSLRKEYFSDLDKLQEAVPTIFRNAVKLEPLDIEQATQAIEGPVKDLGISYEADLVKIILNDLLLLDEQGWGRIEPPQLQIVCRHLYEGRSGKVITLKNYKDAGQAQGVLGTHLTRVMEQFGPSRRVTAQQVLVALITSEESKKMLSQEELEVEIGQEDLTEILKDLVDERLLRRHETVDGFQYELAHQYLVKEIRKSISDEQWKIKEIKDLLERELSNWYKFPGTFIAKDRLQIIKPLLEDGRLTVSKAIEELIAASRIHHAEEELKRVRAIQSARMISLGQLVLAIDRGITSPLSAIISNGEELRETVNETKKILEQLPGLLIELSHSEEVWPTLGQSTDDDADDPLRQHLHRLFEAVSRHVVEVLNGRVNGYISDEGLWDNLEEIGEILEQVQGAGEQMADLLKALSSFLRPDQAYKSIDLHHTLNTAQLLLRGSYGYSIQINEQYDEQLPRISGSAGQLVQLFMSILLNGIEAIEAKQNNGFRGVIEIKTSHTPDMVHIDITDNGIGIPEEHIKKVFSPNFKTKGAPHQGLGLSIVQSIVQEHEGSINISSELQKGTTLKIQFPVIDMEKDNE